MSRPFENLKVLLVDDYEIIRKRLSEDLQSLGFAVTESVNGFEALSVLRSESFDILFTDLVMPDVVLKQGPDVSMGPILLSIIMGVYQTKVA